MKKTMGSKVHSIPLFDHFPPEALQCDQYDPSSVDIWSLGVIICILFYGEIYQALKPLKSSGLNTKPNINHRKNRYNYWIAFL